MYTIYHKILLCICMVLLVYMEVLPYMIDSFQEDAEKFEGNAEMLKVLAHPVRLCIVKGLIDRGACNVSTMYTRLNMPQSTISQHLAKLKSAKIVTSERKGLEIYYNVENKKVIQLVNVLF